MPSRSSSPRSDGLHDWPAELVGQSPVVRRLRGLVIAAAARRAPVLIVGAEGADLAAIAEEIHRRDGRVAPLVAVDCSDAGAEAALFGRAGAGERSPLGRLGRGAALARVRSGTLVLQSVERL
ncbi:MAG TPA: sigma 54-interacting transcriptional regulator, partial [Vicinamibacterales bacterium]|nr:sigma 54-interacting transcriptional regulator [Vicinamibacterales bacterium]